MELISGTYHDGHVSLDGAVDWPDGSTVAVKLAERTIGLSEESWPRNEGAIELLLKKWDTIQPLILTDAEQAVLAATRKRMGQISTAKLNAKVDER